MGKEGKRKRERSDSSDSDSSSSKHKKHKKDKKEKKSKEQKKHKSKKSDSKKRDVEPITEEDYFAKNPEFRVWLTESKGKRFGDLSEQDARSYFRKFVKHYNNGDLSSRIYKGISFSELDGSARHSHKWTFTKSLDNLEQETLRDRIFHDTSNSSLFTGPGKQNQGARGGIIDLAPPPPRIGGSSNTALQLEAEEAQEKYKASLKSERKAVQKHHKEVMEELVPRPDPGSFQARMEKRYAKGAYCRDKRGGDSPEMRQSDLMGGGDDIRARLERQQVKKEQRVATKQAVQQQKLEAYQEKEKATMNEFRRMMGLPPTD